MESVNAFSFLSVTPLGLARVRQSTEADDGMALLKAVIQAGWPDTLEEVPWRARGYFHYRDELTVQDGLILKGERLVIPLSMREVKQKLHQSLLEYRVVSEDLERLFTGPRWVRKLKILFPIVLFARAINQISRRSR